ncbi:unnamed protein product [Blepharisma stoltei]|uniref:Uncharacterized protein n=1 Tax=Blepharisma stoltei TaxID=1481888 RepID=A0AAU9K8U9_9CILI|nr:unnamed protein product [Blepharisma stoltei]
MLVSIIFEIDDIVMLLKMREWSEELEMILAHQCFTQLKTRIPPVLAIMILLEDLEIITESSKDLKEAIN